MRHAIYGGNPRPLEEVVEKTRKTTEDLEALESDIKKKIGII